MDFDALPQLDGDRVSLVPLSLDHLDDLESAVSEGDLWKTWYTRIPSADGMRADIERRLALRETRELLPWGIRDNARGVMVGMTTFLNIVPADRRVEIGSTWLSKSSQRTGINTEAKLLQLTYAFEGLDCVAVEFRAHWHNHQSRAAIAGLGAKQDGVLRNHTIWRDGSMRDTVVFSIIASEWPTVRLGLKEKLARRA